MDAELSRALATLESEKEAAMKTLDAQVRTWARSDGSGWQWVHVQMCSPGSLQ